MLRLALLLGGPSDERAISLNSARSVADHLEGDDVVLQEIIYFDRSKRAHSISRALLYSNNPGDFDFKVSKTAEQLTGDELATRLRACDLTFPVMHGRFGEDGEIQALLEEFGVPYIGSGVDACRIAYDKFAAQQHLAGLGIATVPSTLFVNDGTPEAERLKLLSTVAPSHSALVLKPTAGGSSIDVEIAANHVDAAPIVEALLRRHDRVVAEPWMTGTEFTTVVLDGGGGPVALVPLEIEIRNASSDHEIFSFRRKYLATADTRYHCPARFPDPVVDRIRAVSEAAFRALGLRDFARIDGWVDDEGRVLISDVNPISGMEQNSFLFIQAAQVGMTHRDVLRFVVLAACRRAGVEAPVDLWREPVARGTRRPIAVLFGGRTAERQVSVLSGTNVWLKLLESDRYDPIPSLLDADGRVWLLSYPVALRHTVEEITAACDDAFEDEPRRQWLNADVVHRLGLQPWQQQAHASPPRKVEMDEFLTGQTFIFNALHGGDGEDGTLQRQWDARGISYNGCGPKASAICMDKFETGRLIEADAQDGIAIPPRTKLSVPTDINATTAAALWEEATAGCRATTLVVKPVADGCSAGVVPLVVPAELAAYLAHLHAGATRIEGGVFSKLAPDQIVELPPSCPTELLFEQFIDTDDVTIVDEAPPEVTPGAGDDSQPDDGGGAPARLQWATERDTGWIEVTIGVLGRSSEMRALSPSMTIARDGVLSLEEKFMGGTGVNITPPPVPPLGLVSEEAITAAKERAAHVAKLLGVQGYARIDAFMHRDTGDLIVIEVNSLPALTPSTVLYHQALSEEPPLFPRQLLEKIIDLGFDRQGGG